MSQKTIIDNLYLTGHWTNLSSGITFVANSAYITADLILHKEHLKK
jgi:phytoene dehydrogenase-like protein